MSAIFKRAAKTRHKKWAVRIQHCPISSKLYMWVDNDVPKLIPDIEKFLPVVIFKMATTIPPKIQHCPISSKFDMWVDNDVPTLKNFYWSPF
jgi:hypothetical protein